MSKEIFKTQLHLATEPGNNLLEGTIFNQDQLTEDGDFTDVKPTKTRFINILAELSTESEVISLTAHEDIEHVRKNIFDNMVVAIDVDREEEIESDVKGFYLCGPKALALRTGAQVSSFKPTENVTKYLSKIPVVNSIAIAASKAVQEYLEANGDIIPKQDTYLTANVENFVTTLPIQEVYSKTDLNVTKHYTERYQRTEFEEIVYATEDGEEEEVVNESHFEVKVYVAGQPINVNVNFNRVLVLPEAVAALYAFACIQLEDTKDYNLMLPFLKKAHSEYNFNSHEEFLNSVREKIKTENPSLNNEEFEEKYEEVLDELNSSLLNRESILFDIGAGTSDAAVMHDNNTPDSTFSTFVDKTSVYYAIDSVLKVLREQLDDFDLMHFNVSNILSTGKYSKVPVVKRKYEKTFKLVKDELMNRKSQIITTFDDLTSHLEKNNRYTEYIAIFGGGANLIGEEIEFELDNLTKDFGTVVFTIPEEFATNLNILGISNILSLPDFFEKLLVKKLNEPKQVIA